MLWRKNQGSIEDRPRPEVVTVPGRRTDIRETKKRKCLMYSSHYMNITMGINLGV